VYNPSSVTRACKLFDGFPTQTNEGGFYELFNLKRGNEHVMQDDSQNVMRGAALGAVFTSRTRLAVLDNASQISLKNLQNETKRKIALPFNNANYLFAAQIGHVLIRCADAVHLFELEGRKVCK
jgi:coatomer protein complex subunit alpha (xenin)